MAQETVQKLSIDDGRIFVDQSGIFFADRTPAKLFNYNMHTAMRVLTPSFSWKSIMSQWAFVITHKSISQNKLKKAFENLLITKMNGPRIFGNTQKGFLCVGQKSNFTIGSRNSYGTIFCALEVVLADDSPLWLPAYEDANLLQRAVFKPMLFDGKIYLFISWHPSRSVLMYVKSQDDRSVDEENY